MCRRDSETAAKGKRASEVWMIAGDRGSAVSAEAQNLSVVKKVNRKFGSFP